MAFDPFAGIPLWVYQGVLVGVLSTVCVAATFVLAFRVFPEGTETRGSGDTGASGSWGATETRRRAEIRRYLDAIDERYTEDATVRGEDVAFYLSERDVAVTFDARTFLALERVGSDCVLAEHEMPGAALGHRLPFETPSVSETETETGDSAGGRRTREWSQRRGRAFRRARDASEWPAGRGRDRESAAAAFAVLGLPDTADADAVRRAYRDRIKEVHPDQGGDEAAFQKVREAYDTARRYTS